MLVEGALLGSALVAGQSQASPTKISVLGYCVRMSRSEMVGLCHVYIHS